MNAAAGQMAEGRAVDVRRSSTPREPTRPQATFAPGRPSKSGSTRNPRQPFARPSRADASAATTEARGCRATVPGSPTSRPSTRASRPTSPMPRHAAPGQVDTVTPERLAAIETEAADPATSATRRTQLENERAMLTGGRDAAADALETARTASQIEGLQSGAAGLQTEIERTQGKADPLAAKAEAQRLAGSQALGAVSDRVSGQEGILQDLAARSTAPATPEPSASRSIAPSRRAWQPACCGAVPTRSRRRWPISGGGSSRLPRPHRRRTAVRRPGLRGAAAGRLPRRVRTRHAAGGLRCHERRRLRTQGGDWRLCGDR